MKLAKTYVKMGFLPLFATMWFLAILEFRVLGGGEAER